MNKQAPEDFNDLCSDLATTIANVIDHSDCPIDLRDVLNETVYELQNAIAPSVSELLRALAGLAKARNTGARPEAETLDVANSERNGRRQTREAEALAKASSIQ